MRGVTSRKSRISGRCIATLRELAVNPEEVAAGDVTITFGQHKGQPLKSLPDGYLRVLARMARSKWGLLAEDVLNERGSVAGKNLSPILEQDAYSRLLRNANSVEAVELVRARISGSDHRHDVELLNSLVQAHGKYACLEEAKQVLHGMQHQNGESWNVMIDMYAQNGLVMEAQSTFDAIPVRDVVCWVTMLKAFTALGYPDLARMVFEAMPMHDNESATEIMNILVSAKHAVDVKLIFNRMAERDVRAYNSVMHAYALDGHLSAVRTTMEKMPEWEMETVNAMIQAYASDGCIDAAKRLFDEFPERNEDTVTTMMRAYAHHGRAEEAQDLFDQLLRRTEECWTILFSAYSRSGQVETAKLIYDRAPSKNEHSWTVLIEEYARNLQLEDAEATFDKSPMWSVRSWIAMIWSYAQSGHEHMARIVFNKSSSYDAGVWNAFIAGVTLLGRASDAIQVFPDMNLEGFHPDEMTFLSLLHACSAQGLAKQGGKYFRNMIADYGMSPWKDHYSAVVELLARAKYLGRAWSLVDSMPFEPDSTTWKALFHACRHDRDLKLQLQAAKKLILLDGKDAMPYTMLAESYAAAGKQEKVALVRRLMEKAGCKKPGPNISWILIKNKFHSFIVGDNGHPMNSEISAELCDLIDKIEKAGYKPDTRLMLDEALSEKEKEEVLRDHSEKIALAFGMISTKPRCSIRIINNSKVCSDCHNAFKLVSLVTGRLIVLRDDTRIHQFERGNCRCGDFW